MKDKKKAVKTDKKSIKKTGKNLFPETININQKYSLMPLYIPYMV